MKFLREYKTYQLYKVEDIDIVDLGSEGASRLIKNDILVYLPDTVIELGNEIQSFKFEDEAIEYIDSNPDIQVRVKIIIKLKSQEDLQNLQVKLVSNPQGFNQVDKRWVDKYVELWNIPNDITKTLKLFTGEIKPIIKNVKDPRRMFLTEMRESAQKKLLDFFEENKILIVSDILKGRGEFSADWMLVILKIDNKITWVLKSINEAMNVFGGGDVKITNRGSLRIGKIGMQRKGGDRGRETAKMLQFKINPIELFENNKK